MFLASAQKERMSQPNGETERQNLLERLLDAVKQCQVRFGGKTELATDGDSRVTCLLLQLVNVMQHGFRKRRSSAFRQVGQVAGIVRHEPEQVYWSFIKEHLSKMEVERFYSLHNITTDTGRGKAWLRSTLNEHTLEKYFHSFIGDRSILSNFYEPEAFLMDEERASMLSMMAAGLSSILFALNIDNEELNASKMAMSPPSTREVLNSLLPTIPIPSLPTPAKTQPEPQPIYSADIAEPVSIKVEKKKKKKKKKVNPAIVSIEEESNSTLDSAAELEKMTNKLLPTLKDFPLTDASADSTEKATKGSGHSRSFSYPGHGKLVKEETQSAMEGVETPSEIGMKFHDMSKPISIPDSLVENVKQAKGTEVEPSKRKAFVGSFKFKRNTPSKKGTVEHENQVGKSNFFVGSFDDRLATNHDNFMTDKTKLDQSDLWSRRDEEVLPNTNGTAGSVTNVTPVVTRYCDELPDKISKHLNTELGAIHREPSPLPPRDDHEVFSPEHSNSVGDTRFRNPPPLPPRDTIETLSPTSEDTQQYFSTTENFHGTQDMEENIESRRLNTMESRHSSAESPIPDDTRESDSPVTFMDGRGRLMTVIGDDGEDREFVFQLPSQEDEANLEADRLNPTDSSKDDISLSSSYSWVEDSDHGRFDLGNESSESLETAVGAAATALAACSDAQRGLEQVTRFSSLTRPFRDAKTVDDSGGHDGMSTAELKQAIVSMMLRKDEIEEQNRSLRHLLDKEMEQSADLRAETEQLKLDIKQRSDKDLVKIQALTRENELLKHQLKKYVGAVQMLRRDLKGQQSAETTEALSGIRQHDSLPSLPPKEKTEKEQSEETNEYKRKLIQVAEMHGELMEFNERVQRQLNHRTVQVRRLREELINLRGPLPGSNDTDDDLVSLSDFEASVSSMNTRPLINIWIPSVFLKGKSSSVYHVYQVYARIKDDEWNVYRRYSQFYDLHRKLRHQFKRKITFDFPPKKTVGNRDSKFVEERRRQLQEYLRKVINYIILSNPELSSNTNRETLLTVMPFLGDPYPPEKVKKNKSKKQNNS